MKKQIFVIVIALLLVVGSVNAINMTINNLSDAEITLTVDELRELLGQQKFFAEEELGAVGNAPRDVIGTRTGSSTVAVGFYEWAAASTTYSTYIGRDIDTAIYDIYFTNASTSVLGGANLHYSILTSNDSFCNASSSTYYSGLNNYIIPEVQWFDASDHLTNKVHSTALPIATTTFAVTNPVTNSGRQIVLENLNSQCLALQVNGTSTEIQVQLSTKQFSY